jgi:murein DD-endopeptidase MepM/ murein hydrolase activator NlpD
MHKFRDDHSPLLTRRRFGALSAGTIAAMSAPASALAAVKPLGLVLPTRNRAIYTSDQSRFYMYIDRSFEGRKMKVWQGGKYGYVRNPVRTSSGIVYTKFHEGLDIAPVSRDKNDEPLDTVRSIAHGKVVHTSANPRHSSYGSYVVVEHDWGYGRFYSLYAHLRKITAAKGAKVGPGSPLGVLGYTGPGLDRTRAHVHLELNLILDSRFERWHDKNFSDSNYHGMYNGLNLIGIDIAGLYLAHQREPNITIPQFMARMTPYFKVTVPRQGTIQVLDNYRFLARDMATARGKPSWEITLSASGVPLAIAPSSTKVSSPKVTWVKYSASPHSYNTRKRLSGSGKTASLTSSGLRYIQLLAGQF